MSLEPSKESSGKKRARSQSHSLESRTSETAKIDEDTVNATSICESAYRLTRLKKPQISVGRKRMIENEEEYQQQLLDNGKKPVERPNKRMRNAGKLADLMNMPVDVFFEIMSKLHPLDILQLARVSKHFRATFMKDSSKHVWVAARRNVPGLPDCAPDLNEAQYASLLFENNCDACGKGRAMRLDFSLRVRMCASCFNNNVKRGSTVLRKLKFKPDIYALLPRSMLKPQHRTRPTVANFNVTDNNSEHLYLKEELEMLVGKYRQHEDDVRALAQFLKEQKESAACIMAHAVQLHEWNTAKWKAKGARERADMHSRVASITAKLKELGFEEQYFPRRYDDEWNSLVYQPRKLTDRIWNHIRPKLELVLARSKQQVLSRERKFRLECRRAEFVGRFEEYAATLPPEERYALPSGANVAQTRTTAALLAAEDCTIEVTPDRWNTILPEILPVIDRYKRLGVWMLLSSMNAEDFDNTDDTQPLEEHLFVLRSPTVLFQCSSPTCGSVESFPAILRHRSQCGPKPYGLSSGTMNNEEIKLEYKKEYSELAGRIISTLNVMPDSLGDVQFECACGHPRFQAGLSIGRLAQHLWDENEWYRARSDNQKIKDPVKDNDAMKIVLQNDHDIRDLVSLVRIHPASANAPTLQTQPYSAMYCRFCAMLGGVTGLPNMPEVVHHMSRKHGVPEAETGGTTIHSFTLRSYGL